MIHAMHGWEGIYTLVTTEWHKQMATTYTANIQVGYFSQGNMLIHTQQGYAHREATMNMCSL